MALWLGLNPRDPSIQKMNYIGPPKCVDSAYIGLLGSLGKLI